MAWACCARACARCRSPNRPKARRTHASWRRAKRAWTGRSRPTCWRARCVPSIPDRSPKAMSRGKSCVSIVRWRSTACTPPRPAPCSTRDATASTSPAARARCACACCSARAERRSRRRIPSTSAATCVSRPEPPRMKAAPGVALRVAAAQALDAVVHRGQSLKADLAQRLPTFPDPRDRALLEAIAFTALRNRARYDAALQAWMAKPLGRRDAPLRALLHAGFAQVDMQLSPHAAVDATVEAARTMGRTHQAGMVNALLRRALREGLPAGDAAQAWPQWLRKRVARDWPQDAAAIFQASATPAPMWLRVNRTRIARDAYLAKLHEAGIETDAPDALPDALVLATPLPVHELPGFDEGLVSVQDGSAQCVADALAPAPGARVLDACAAPGGKSAHLLERDPALRLLALDIDPARLRRVQETHARLGVDGGNATLRAADASDLAAWWDGTPFDAILLDAPCSATGIVRRQPDVLLHRRESDLATLTATQARLLDACWRALASGGVLLYATCSILSEENTAQIDAFLARTPDAVAEPLDARYGRASGAGRQRLPGEDGMDGFFYARLRKV